MNNKDSIFFRNFSLLIGFLIVLTAVLALLGAFMNSAIIKEQKLDRSLIEKKLKPIAAVHTESNPPAAEKPAAAQAEMDPETIYKTVCAACHETGAAGAPKPGSDDWNKRVAKGKDVLFQHAINGFNAMPPKGGRPDLSDETIMKVVEYMIAKGNGKTTATPESKTEATSADETSAAAATPAPAAETAAASDEDRLKHGQQIFQQVCFACHGTGAAGAPKLEKAAWKDRLAKGKEALYNSALHGIGVMPPKGGRMDLSDEDIKAAVDYMISQVQ